MASGCDFSGIPDVSFWVDRKIPGDSKLRSEILNPQKFPVKIFEKSPIPEMGVSDFWGRKVSRKSRIKSPIPGIGIFEAEYPTKKPPLVRFINN